MDRGHPNGHRQQDIQQYHVWKTIQDNQQMRREMPIWIHSWSCMPRCHTHDQDNSTYETQPQPSNMGGIRRTIQGLWQLQSRITHRHTRNIWRTPKNMISNQTHIQQKNSQAYHWKGRQINWLQSGCKTRRQHGPSNISVLNNCLFRNTRSELTALGVSKAQFTRKEK